jgi:hypothetical protein
MVCYLTRHRFSATANSLGMTTSRSANLDIFELFGETIETFRGRQNTVIELIWQSQIENEDLEEGEAIEVQYLSRWLASQDRVISTINRDHEAYVDNQAVRSSTLRQKHALTSCLAGVYMSLVQQTYDQVLPERQPPPSRHWPTWHGKNHTCWLTR